MNAGAEILERERVDRGWSNQRLASELEIDEPMASRIRRGLYLPNREVAVRIRDRLGIDPALWDRKTEG